MSYKLLKTMNTVFRPQSLIPDVDFQGSFNELINNQNTDG
jgi:hypothetical protein